MRSYFCKDCISKISHDDITEDGHMEAHGISCDVCGVRVSKFFGVKDRAFIATFLKNKNPEDLKTKDKVIIINEAFDKIGLCDYCLVGVFLNGNDLLKYSVGNNKTIDSNHTRKAALIGFMDCGRQVLVNDLNKTLED